MEASSYEPEFQRFMLSLILPVKIELIAASMKELEQAMEFALAQYEEVRYDH